MIKINLLPKRDVKKTVKKFELRLPSRITKILIIPIGITLIILSVVFLHTEATKSELNKDIDAKKKVIQELQKKIAEVKKFEAMNKDIEEKTELIENLKKMQSAPVNILSAVAKKLPEGVWLTAVTTSDDSVTVDGMAFSNFNVVTFVENLKATPDFQDVALIESQQTELEKQLVYKFIVKFKIKV